MGFEHAVGEHSTVNVFSSEIDGYARRTYKANFSDEPRGDLTEIPSDSVPDHDILLAGFPCQPFSRMGGRLGLEDSRSTLFLEVARILRDKRPRAFLLENVKGLVNHNRGGTLDAILGILEEIGYYSYYDVLDAVDFGVPQRRERIYIVGFRKLVYFEFPEGNSPISPLESVLETTVPKKYVTSHYPQVPH